MTARDSFLFLFVTFYFVAHQNQAGSGEPLPAAIICPPMKQLFHFSAWGLVGPIAAQRDEASSRCTSACFGGWHCSLSQMEGLSEVAPLEGQWELFRAVLLADNHKCGFGPPS